MSMQKLLSIEIEFNNLEYILVPGKYIGIFQLDGMEEIKGKSDSNYWVKSLVLSIDRNYKGCICNVFDDEQSKDCGMDCLSKGKNISSIKRTYEDGSSDRILVNWYGEVIHVKDERKVYDPQYQNHNEYQHSKTNKHGDLFVEIGEKAELDSIFPDEVINADDYTVEEPRTMGYSDEDIILQLCKELFSRKNYELNYELNYVDELPSCNDFHKRYNELMWGVYVVLEGGFVVGLCIHYPNLFELPELISNLTKLKRFDVSCTPIRELPLWISNFSKLQELNISRVRIRILPEWMGTLLELKKLNIRASSITELPKFICNMPELIELNCAHTELKKLPTNFGNLKRLKVLDLHGSKIEELPNSIGNLSELEVLRLDLTFVKSLPESFPKLSALKKLFLPIFIELPESIEMQIEEKGGVLERGVEFYKEKEGKLVRNTPCHSRRTIEELLQKGFPDNTVVISFHNIDVAPVDYTTISDKVFYVEFDDIPIAKNPLTSFDLSYLILSDKVFPQVEKLAEFIRNAIEKDLNIICQCESGYGFSSGCAATIQYYQYGHTYYGDFSEYTTLNQEIQPNLHIYNRVLNALNKGPSLPNFAHFLKVCENTDVFSVWFV